VLCSQLSVCYVYFAPLPCVCEVVDAADNEKISQQNIMQFSFAVVIHELTNPLVDLSVT